MRLFLSVLIILFSLQSCYALDNSNNLQTDGLGTKYTFEESMNGKVVKIEKGATFPITLQTPIDTSTIQESDEVAATLNEDLKIDGAIVAKQNSVLYGKVIKAKKASTCMRGGKVKIKFDKLVTTENKMYTISTKAVDFVVSAEDKLKVIAQSVAELVIIAACVVFTGGAGAAVLACCMMSAPTGFLPVFARHGNDAVIPAQTSIEVSLNDSLNAIATY